jgi:DNA polymerase III gamma/tau subunit
MYSNLIGNEEVKDTLRRLLASGRMPGSLLFTGSEGVGKKLLEDRQVNISAFFGCGR